MQPQRFDSNYQYVVPELSDSVEFKLNFNKALDEYSEAKNIGIDTCPVVFGLISFLVLGRAVRDTSASFQPISLLPKLLPVYSQLLFQLKQAGAEWVQIDESILVLDFAINFQTQYAQPYMELEKVAPKIMLTTYFYRLDTNISFIAKLPVTGLHIDLDCEPSQLKAITAAIKSTNAVPSLRLVSGWNIWKTVLPAAIGLSHKVVDALTVAHVIIDTSSSLLHIPVTLASEDKLTSEQKDWFSFTLEKAGKVSTIASVLSGS